MPMSTFERFAGACAFAVAAGGVAYGIAFAETLRSSPQWASTSAALLLLLGGMVGAAVVVALFERLRDTAPSLAVLGMAVGLVAVFGAAIHGGFDLAVIAHPPARPFDAPNPVDPRGLMTFGMAGLSLGVAAWLILAGGALPRRLGWLAAISAVLLEVIYVGRLTILNPKNPVLLTAALVEGLVVNPAFYVWLGLRLRREDRAVSATPS